MCHPVLSMCFSFVSFILSSFYSSSCHFKCFTFIACNVCVEVVLELSWMYGLYYDRYLNHKQKSCNHGQLNENNNRFVLVIWPTANHARTCINMSVFVPGNECQKLSNIIMILCLCYLL